MPASVIVQGAYQYFSRGDHFSQIVLLIEGHICYLEKNFTR